MRLFEFAKPFLSFFHEMCNKMFEKCSHFHYLFGSAILHEKQLKNK